MEIKVTKTTNPKPIPQDESTLGFGLKFTDHMFLMDWDEGQFPTDRWRSILHPQFFTMPLRSLKA